MSGRNSQDSDPADHGIEAAFAEIVAGWDQSAPDPIPRWPAAEDATSTASSGSANYPPEPKASEPKTSEPTAPETDQDGPDWPGAPELGPRDWEPQPTLEVFVPPEPGPLPRTDALTWLAWLSVLGAPLVVILASWRDLGQLWVLGAVLAFIAGFGLLVSKLPRSRDDDDDGAVV